MTSSSPIGLEGSDLSSVNTMMSAVMSVGKVAENGGSPQSTKSPTKPPGPNRIGRRNQVSSCALAGDIWWLQSMRTLGEVCSLKPQLPKPKPRTSSELKGHAERLQEWTFPGLCQFLSWKKFSLRWCQYWWNPYSLPFNLIWMQAVFTWWPRQRIGLIPLLWCSSFPYSHSWLIGILKPPPWFLFLSVFRSGSK